MQPDSTDSSLPYTVAVTGTIAIIDARARRYRRLVLVVIIALCGAAAWSALQRAWEPLLGLLILPPMFAEFVYADTAAVDRWRRVILDSWVHGRLELDRFREIMRSVPTLPVATIDSMLATLPATGPHSPLGSQQRAVVAATVAYLGARCADRVVTDSGVRMIVVGALIGALGIKSWLPLSGLFISVVFIGAAATTTAIRTRRWTRELETIGETPPSERDAIVRALEALDWHGVSTRTRVRVLDTLR